MLSRLLWTLPAIIWMVILYLLSNTPNLTFSPNDTDFLIRKTGHFAAYTLLFFLIYRALVVNAGVQISKAAPLPESRIQNPESRVWLPWSQRLALTALALTILYAIFDEWHQSWVDTRNGSPWDVLLDSAGAVTGLAMLAWLEWWRRVTDQPDTNPVSTFNYLGAAIQENQIPALASKLAEMLQGGEVIALTGDLGAGKTTFTKALAKALGVRKTVTSPTYTIEKQYPAANGRTFCHYDWYRLDSAESVDYLDIEEKIGQPNAIIVIEWPERAPQLLPPDTIRIEFTYVDQQTRKITLHR